MLGTSVELHDMIKLIPEVPDRVGMIQMTDKIEAKEYEIDVEFTLRSRPQMSDGFGIYLTNK